MKKMFTLLLCCLLLSGCTATPAGTTVPTDVTTVPETTMQSTTEASLPLNIFVPDENAEDWETIPTTIDVLDAELILEMLVSHSILDEGIELNSADLMESQLNLDFNQAFLDQLLSYGTAGERMMIGCVVNTYLSTYDAEAVYITVNGEIMESGHVVYDFPMEFFE